MVNEVEHYLNEIAVINGSMRVDKQRAKFIERYMQPKLLKLKKNAENIALHKDGTVEFTGNILSIEATRKALTDLVNGIISKEIKITKSCINNYFASEKGKECIKRAESNEECVIKMSGSETSKNTRTHHTGPKGSAQIDLDAHYADSACVASCSSATEHALSDIHHTADNKPKKTGAINVSVVQGDITNEYADAIVVTCTRELDLKQGQVTRAILTKVGDAGLDISSFITTMQQEGLVIIPVRNMHAKTVIFVTKQTCQSEWKGMILKALIKAEARHLTRIFFPTLGTGYGCTPIDVGSTMRAAIDEFSHMNVKNVKEIRIVVFNADMLADFNRGFNTKYASGSSNKGLPSEPLDKDLKENQQGDKNYMTVYSSSYDGIKRAKKFIETTIEEEWTISHPIHIQNLDDKQIKELKAEAKKNHVSVVHDRTQKTVELVGLTWNVSTVKDTLNYTLRTVDKHIHEQEKAALLRKVVEWTYTKEDREVKFDQTSNQAIENAYNSQQMNIRVASESKTYDVDLAQMKAREKSKPKTTYNLHRGEPSIIPSHWVNMGDKTQVECVSLTTANEEYSCVETEFHGSIGRETYHIVKIERIQNPTLYAQYSWKKKQMEAAFSRGNCEKKLWHGTANTAVKSINSSGFNRSYCGKNATVYGQGVYFAKDASYSAQHTYSPADASGHRRMYCCLVLTGEYTLGTSDMRLPPHKNGGDPNRLYDSLVNNTASPSIFVIFNDTQAYPEYLITFKDGPPDVVQKQTAAPVSFMVELLGRMKRKN